MLICPSPNRMRGKEKRKWCDEPDSTMCTVLCLGGSIPCDLHPCCRQVTRHRMPHSVAPPKHRRRRQLGSHTSQQSRHWPSKQQVSWHSYIRTSFTWVYQSSIWSRAYRPNFSVPSVSDGPATEFITLTSPSFPNAIIGSTWEGRGVISRLSAREIGKLRHENEEIIFV